MKVVKLSALGAYQIKYELFRYGNYYQKDIAEKNRFFDKLYVCINEENDILAAAYMGQEKGAVYFDCMSVRNDLKGKGIGTFFVSEIKKIFPTMPLKALPQENSMSFWLNNGFKHQPNSFILVYNPTKESIEAQ